MTDQHPNQTTPPGGEPFADEPIPDAGTEGAATAKGREWLSQLESMIQDIATQAAPVAKQVAAKAAELTAVAAVKAGPLVQRAAEVTSDAGQKLADRAQNLAAELRGDGQGSADDDSSASTADASWGGTTDPGTGPAATFEDAVDSTADGSRTTTFEDTASSPDERTTGTSL